MILQSPWYFEMAVVTGGGSMRKRIAFTSCVVAAVLYLFIARPFAAGEPYKLIQDVQIGGGGRRDGPPTTATAKGSGYTSVTPRGWSSSTRRPTPSPARLPTRPAFTGRW